MTAASQTTATAGAPALKIGCCGFAGHQAAYFRDFRLVEVQQTFYDPPRVTTAERWRATAPADFEFTLKAWQLITHEATSPTYRRLRRPLPASAARNVGSFKPTAEVWQAWEQTRAFAAALRATLVVFQCPTSFGPTREHREQLRQFFRRVQAEAGGSRDTCLVLAWEPRGDWSNAEVRELCDELGLLHVVDPFVRLPVTPGPFYFRLHGIGGYGHRYSDAELHRLFDSTRRFPAGGRCLFNNVSMRESALRFARLLAAAAP
jgi:uncharacterized protein YecE (DUF72 family)